MTTFLLANDALDKVFASIRKMVAEGKNIALATDLREIAAPSQKNDYYKINMIHSNDIYKDESVVSMGKGAKSRNMLPKNYMEARYLLFIISEDVKPGGEEPEKEATDK